MQIVHALEQVILQQLDVQKLPGPSQRRIIEGNAEPPEEKPGPKVNRKHQQGRCRRLATLGADRRTLLVEH